MTDNTANADGTILHWHHIVPVGSVIAWLKSYTNTPTLGESWVECNGQTISDVNSPFNGQTVPNLNGSVGGGLKGRYLRGDSTSGTTQTDDVKDHTHKLPTKISNGGGAAGNSESGTYTTETTGVTTGGEETRPFTYTVVWIMRIK